LRLRLKSLVLGLLSLCLAGAAPPSELAPRQAPRPPFVLQVIVNGAEASEDIVVQDEVGHLTMLRRDLVALGLPLPVSTGDSIPLDTLPGVSVVLDSARQILRLDFSSHDRKKNRVTLGPGQETIPVTRSATGLLLNYDLTANAQRGGTTVGGLVEARLFSGIGTLSTGAIGNSGARGPQAALVRLDTTYTVIDPARFRRYSAGDVVSGSLPSSRAVRLAGLQISTDFSVRPDLVTYPVPMLSGSAAVPSTLDVLVNGSRVGEGRVMAGDFGVAGTPMVNGSGTVDLVLRDALGRETRTSVNVYGVRTLLAPGLSDCTLDIGAVRRRYGLRSNDYRFVASTATCRFGLSDRFTVEGHGEATADLALASGGAVLGLGRFGVVSLGLSASTGEAGSKGAVEGSQLSFGYEIVSRPVSFNLAVVKATQGYRDIAVQAGDPPVRTSILALVGFDLARYGSLSVSLARLSGSRVPDIYHQDAAAAAPERASLVTATYSASIGRRVNLYVNVLRDIDRSRSTMAMVGLSILLGQRTSALASTSFTHRSTLNSAQVIRSVTEPGELGYRLQADEGSVSHQLAEATYRGSDGEVMGGVERVNGQIAARVGMRGALVFAGGDMLTGNTLSGSFAIVDAGVPGVGVLRDNRPAGVTNSRGRLLLPNLRTYQTNLLAIDPLTLPDDVLPTTTEVKVRPGDRTGVVAVFAARHGRSARVRLIDSKGSPLTVGERATLNRLAETVPVGFDGEIFFSNLAPDNRIEVARANGTCIAVFAVRDGPVPPIIGPIACT
jgi:outer membrane usher protein